MKVTTIIQEVGSKAMTQRMSGKAFILKARLCHGRTHKSLKASGMQGMMLHLFTFKQINFRLVNPVIFFYRSQSLLWEQDITILVSLSLANQNPLIGSFDILKGNFTQLPNAHACTVKQAHYRILANISDAAQQVFD